MVFYSSKVICAAGSIQASNKSSSIVLLAATVLGLWTKVVLPHSQHHGLLAVNLYSYVLNK